MKISKEELRNIIREVSLSATGRQVASDALTQKVKDEGGAMGVVDAKAAAEAAANVEMTDEEFEDLAKSVGIDKHEDGDVVDTTGLPTGGIAESIALLSKAKLREMIEKTVSNELNEDVMGDVRNFIKKVQSSISSALVNDVMAPEWREGDTVNYDFKVDLSKEDYPAEIDASGAEEEQIDFIKEKFEEEKENNADMFSALADKYGSFNIPITVTPPEYDSGAIDFDLDEKPVVSEGLMVPLTPIVEHDKSSETKEDLWMRIAGINVEKSEDIED